MDLQKLNQRQATQYASADKVSGDGTSSRRTESHQDKREVTFCQPFRHRLHCGDPVYSTLLYKNRNERVAGKLSPTASAMMRRERGLAAKNSGKLNTMG